MKCLAFCSVVVGKPEQVVWHQGFCVTVHLLHLPGTLYWGCPRTALKHVATCWVWSFCGPEHEEGPCYQICKVFYPVSVHMPEASCCAEQDV